MNETELLIELTAVIALGIAAQALGQKLRWPAILLLLIFGCAAGAGAQWIFGRKLIDPEHMLGDLLTPLVSLAVALVLFEGGLSFKRPELRAVGRALWSLLTIGVLTTWAICGLAAHWLLGFSVELSLLIGAILVVTGPTVVGPLLRQVRPSGRVTAVLKWEGIVIDPIGAILAVLVFEVIVGGAAGAGWTTLATAGKAAAIGLVGGMIGAAILILPLRHYWIPDSLHSPVALAVVALMFCVSNLMQHESGLLTVTVMGVVLANQKWASVQHIVEFKENLRVLLISTLFILLAARLDAAQWQAMTWQDGVFVLVIVVIARPVSVWLSTVGSNLTRNERLYVALIAPRGIVAAAVTTVFALRLHERGMDPGAMVPTVFLVIVGTVAFSGLIAAPAARRLGLVKANPQGVLFVGAHDWVRALAAALVEQKIDVTLVDTNRSNVSAARNEGLRATRGSVLSDHVLESLDLEGVSRMLAVTPNDEANALAAIHMTHLFGRAGVYQLAPVERRQNQSTEKNDSPHLHGRYLFDAKATWFELARRYSDGAVIKTSKLTEQYDLDSFIAKYGDSAIVLFLLDADDTLTPLTVSGRPGPKPGQRLVFMLNAEANEQVLQQRRSEE